MTNILGISAYYHDSAAALMQNGDLVAAAQEERFTRKKHDMQFPENAIRYCLEENNLSLDDIDHVVFYDKPLVKFERLLETYLSYAPNGFRSVVAAMPIWLKEKLFLKTTLKRALAELGECDIQALPELLFAEHHQSHAASTFLTPSACCIRHSCGLGAAPARHITPGVSNLDAFRYPDEPRYNSVYYGADFLSGYYTSWCCTKNYRQ